MGLLEDVTSAILEQQRIERERDYDILTGLYSRQAFNRVCADLFAHPDRLRCAALLMMDLDNLKHINDTYGHDWGDQYIRQTGQCFAANTPKGTVCSRLSGDEFLLLFYGYDSQDAIRKELSTLNGALRASCATLPNGKTLNISISGGVAWFPEDGTDFKTLKKYADFAMYQVKQSHKGHTGDFDIGVYHREEYAAQTQREFEQLLREELVTYYFQPIFSAHSGRVAAYEALMRVNMPTITSPSQVMTLAHELDRLYDIERITLFKSGETYQQLQQKGLLQNGAFLFVNSIANVSLTPADVAKYQRRFPELLKYLVVEITEQEDLDRDSLERKRNVPGFSGSFALDDYGSGYSNELNLLALAPRYIKIDISIVRGIDTDRDKQQIVSNIVDYAHARSMQLIAEGIENDAELRKVIELGADALQGYFLAKPAAVPAKMAPAARKVIAEYHLDEIIGRLIGKEAGLFLDLAAYSIVTENNAGQYYPDYAYEHALFTPDMKIYTDSKVSDFFQKLKPEQSVGFLNSWNKSKNKRQKIYLSYDSTNKNCQAGDIDLLEHGNAKTDVSLPIFNYSVACDSANREPLFYELYPGSINDISQLTCMIDKAHGYG